MAVPNTFTPTTLADAEQVNENFLDLDKRIGEDRRTVTQSGPIFPEDRLIFANATSGPITLTLPLASASLHEVKVKKTDASGNAVTVQRAGGDTIDGATTKAHGAQNESYIYDADGVSLWGIF